MSATHGTATLGLSTIPVGWSCRCVSALAFLSVLVCSSISAAGYDEGAQAFASGDYTTALTELTTSSEAGDARAQVLLGSMYRQGLGVAADLAQAARWFRSAADQGLPQAQYSLGTLYRKGIGVQRDAAEAAKWYRKAADQNLTAAQVGLGASYFYGDGVPRNYVEAHKWFSLALAGVSVRSSDLDLAKRGIAACESKMTPDQIKQANNLAADWRPTAK